MDEFTKNCLAMSTSAFTLLTALYLLLLPTVKLFVDPVIYRKLRIYMLIFAALATISWTLTFYFKMYP